MGNDLHDSASGHNYDGRASHYDDRASHYDAPMRPSVTCPACGNVYMTDPVFQFLAWHETSRGLSKVPLLISDARVARLGWSFAGDFVVQSFFFAPAVLYALLGSVRDIQV